MTLIVNSRVHMAACVTLQLRKVIVSRCRNNDPVTSYRRWMQNAVMMHIVLRFVHWVSQHITVIVVFVSAIIVHEEDFVLT
ncbi:hypothetical protein V6N11_025014 [Hibiscus sabdariffa]|uniref:Uncharacterized protein n=1 Tax=Hibiscus sabdariffa TaxID=183260 RepID=A0ABR2QP22_9ROSI